MNEVTSVHRIVVACCASGSYTRKDMEQEQEQHQLPGGHSALDLHSPIL